MISKKKKVQTLRVNAQVNGKENKIKKYKKFLKMT